MEDDPQPIFIPFCVDCKHYSIDGKDEVCTLIPNTIDYVHGKKYYNTCSISRMNGVGSCGTEGKHFEPKPIKWYQFWKK